jgi:hypothetical protein
MLSELKETYIEKSKYAAYIPILDINPVFAANFLTKEDLKTSYNLLIKVYNDIKENLFTYKPLISTILDSRGNFMWFATFFKELEKNLEVEEPYNIPYKCSPDNEDSELTIYQPFKATHRKGKVGLTYLKTNVKDQSPINNYRILYIMEDYDMNDFQGDCYPGWYLLKDTTVFEQYNEKTNTRVRIDFRNGEFLYFIAGASDNWQPIPEVPIEMDHVVSALIFRNVRS